MLSRASKSFRTAILGIVSVGVIAIALAGFFAFSPKAEIPDYNVDAEQVAIHGYDTVAYFTDGKPTKGKSQFEHVWQDAHWRFASASNRDLFTANPERYAPQYGGYCALGVSAGEYADGDPKAWTIIDGKLYLNYSMKFRDDVFRKAPEQLIGNANYNWGKNRDQLRNNLGG